MKYQLVLQFPADNLADFDDLTNLEQALNGTLSGIADVDGHDFGLGEFNIFIHTDNPVRAFRLAQAIIETRRPIQLLKAAYRESEQEEYTIVCRSIFNTSRSHRICAKIGRALTH